MVIERFAKGGARVVGTGAGAGVGAALSSPFGLGLLGVVAIIAGLFIFRDKISSFFQDAISGFSLPSLPDISFPDITFPSFPDITFPSFPDISFPDFNFPDFNFPDFSGGLSGLQSQFDQFIIDSQTNLDAAGGGVSDFFGGLQDDFNNFIAGLTPDQPLTEADQFDDSGLAGIDLTPSGEPAVPFNDAALFAQDFPEEFIPNEIPTPFTPPPEIISEFEDQQFTGGGVSFIGGSVTETPVCQLSLSQIIDKFGVSASQAANMKAIACDDFGDFDFGTNTGSGIFGTPTLIPSTQGLSAREISRLISQGLLPPQFLS